jgi:hypothetical protein
MTEAPLIFYADEDDRTLDILRKHLYTLDIVPDKVVLHPSYIGPQLRRMKEEQLFIILVSVDSLVIFKECMGILERMIRQRKQRFDLSGVISVLCRPCAWQETVLAKTQTVSHADFVPITSKGKIDQACLNAAREIRDYLCLWEKKVLHSACMGSEELDLKALYGPAGDGEHFIGNTITFTIANRQTMTGTIIYVKANSEYVVQVEGETDHRIVSPCDVIERKHEVGEN